MVFFAGLEAGPTVEVGMPSSQWPLNQSAGLAPDPGAWLERDDPVY